MLHLVMPSILYFGHFILALCWIFPKPILSQICLVMPCIGLNSALLALSYSLSIPVARVHWWTPMQCRAGETPYNIEIGEAGLGISA